MCAYIRISGCERIARSAEPEVVSSSVRVAYVEVVVAGIPPVQKPSIVIFCRLVLKRRSGEEECLRQEESDAFQVVFTIELASSGDDQ